MSLSTRSIAIVAVTAWGLQIGSACGAIITPTTVTASDHYASGGDDRAEIHTIDSSGLSDVNSTPLDPTDDTHATFANGPPPAPSMWLSNNNGTPIITWDLGANYDLTGFHLWNYNDDNPNPGTGVVWGVAVSNILVSSTIAANDFVTVETGRNDFVIASGLTSYTGLDYTLSSPQYQNVRRVQWAVQDNFTTAYNFTGISEIRFYGTLTPTPEPNAIVLYGIGTLGLFCLRRRKITGKLI